MKRVPEINAMSAHPMDQIPVRALRFDFDNVEDRDPVWSRSSAEFSMFINALGVDVPHFERFLVAVMRAYRDELSDPELLADVQAIIGQESHHAFNFSHWTKALSKRYPKLRALDAQAKRYFKNALADRSKKFHIGFTAGYETFTFLGGLIILQRYDELMADADPTLRALWVWHQVEEVEHGAVAFDFYRAFYPESEWYRRWMVIRAFTHISVETFRAYAHMVRIEGCYRSPIRAINAWKFFLGFAADLAFSALPVLSKSYHPRLHPICNDEQNPIAVSWRSFYAAQSNTGTLDQNHMQRLLHYHPETQHP